MKTKTLTLKQSSYLIALFFMLFSLSSLKAQAPACSYSVVNPGPCSIVVTLDFYNSINNLCQSYTNQTVGAFSTQAFSCGSCNQPLTNVVVTLITVNPSANPSGTPIVDVNVTTSQGGYSSGTTCNSQSNYTMDWFYNQTVIGY